MFKVGDDKVSVVSLSGLLQKQIESERRNNRNRNMYFIVASQSGISSFEKHLAQRMEKRPTDKNKYMVQQLVAYDRRFIRWSSFNQLEIKKILEIKRSFVLPDPTQHAVARDRLW